MLYKITKIDSDKENDFFYSENDETASEYSYNRDYEVEIIQDDGKAFQDGDISIQKNDEVH